MDSQERLCRKDTTKGPPLRVLSLDGGGVRGYSMLILLQELMYKTYTEAEGKPPKPDQIPKPCDYFDLIVGAGTGGLIAIMLGRLRMDIETCKDVYVRMTRRVFETDKTIAGIPYRSTLFKASKLEDAIRDCVRERTILEDEGNDGTATGGVELPVSPGGQVATSGSRRHSHASSMRSGHSAYTPMSPGVGGRFGATRWGNPNASLYDTRENRTKTAVTAVYKGTPRNGRSILLRSYDSRSEPPPEFNCTIWQAGRATSAIGLAFKPIQIGQSVFHDEGAGSFNPTPQVIDECVLNEWPNRDIGVLVSIGTGKRPSGTGAQQSEWWEGFIGGSMGNFAEARRRLIGKIEECEKTHQYVRDEYLEKRGVDPENYYRLNVEVGVGEFGMNEWSRLAEISTSTRMYLSQPDTRRINEEAAYKLGRIERMKKRVSLSAYPTDDQDYEESPNKFNVVPPSNQNAFELPGTEGVTFEHPTRGHPQYRATAGSQDKFSVIAEDALSPSEAMSPQQRRAVAADNPHRLSAELDASDGSIQHTPRRSYEARQSGGPNDGPPRPPKTPMSEMQHKSGLPQDFIAPLRPHPNRLPYPVDDDEPPPVVDMARKPTLQR